MNHSIQNTFDLYLKNKKIISVTVAATREIIRKFSHPETSSQYKIYVVTQKNKILYIGTTKDNIRSRLNSGLSANGEHGYQGYKWRMESTVRLFLWCFEKYNKKQIENIEAELAFLVRQKTGIWPEKQNEIHFNNEFGEVGKEIANIIFEHISDSFSKSNS